MLEETSPGCFAKRMAAVREKPVVHGACRICVLASGITRLEQSPSQVQSTDPKRRKNVKMIPTCLYSSFGILLLTASCVHSAQSRLDEITRLKEPPWPSAPVRVDLKPYGGGSLPEDVSLEFSADSQLVCAWWLPNPPLGDYNKVPGRAVVFDVQGKRIAEATDQDGEAVGKYVSLFPESAWRRRFADFVQDTNDFRTSIWAFTPDYSAGVRFLKPARSDFALGTAELWRFSPTNSRVWLVTIPERVLHTGLGGFFEVDGKSCLLIAFNGMDGYVLSRRDGSLFDHFTYGKPESEAEATARKRKFHLLWPGLDSSLYFSASALAFDPSRRLLACGDSNSRRIRVVMVDRPHKVLFEANTEDNPERPLGGNWFVDYIHFDAGGKYLIVGYYFTGRFVRKSYYPVEIYDTRTWQLVWSMNSSEIYSANRPRVSPDGKTMALIKGDWLEIGPFVPQSDKGVRKTR